MSVVELIEEQSSFGFTGRINVLKEADRQFLGVILLQNGKIVSSQFAKKTGTKALFSLIVCDLEGLEGFRLVVEPEIVDDSDIEFRLDFSDLKRQAQKIYQEHNDNKRLRPPEGLRILINPVFVESGDKPDSTEFLVLKSMTTYSKISDIYRDCDLFDFEITKALVSLRKKGAIKVLK